MCSRRMIVGKITHEHAPQISFAEDDDVIQTLAPYRSDQSLHIWILPGTRRTRDDLCDAHAGDTALADVTVDGIAVSQEPLWRGVFRKGGHDLLRGPFGRRMFSDCHMNDTASLMREENKLEHHAARHCRHREESHGDQRGKVIREEGSPCL